MKSNKYRISYKDKMREIDNCSKCNSKNVMGPFNHSTESGVWIDVGGRFSNKKVALTANICLVCGFTENYISEEDLIELREYLRLKGMRE